MTKWDTDLGSGSHDCPRCGAQVSKGDDCPSCGQALCPECGAAISEDATSCSKCGIELEIFCPSCDAEIEQGASQCPYCGTSFQPASKTGTSELPITRKALSESESDVATVTSKPLVHEAPEHSVSTVSACSICGRRDETLRIVVYPYVISLVFVTFRRAFAGLWCNKHRNFYQALASLITATLGWIGIPFGLIFTPLTLFRLAKGGDQPVEPNLRLLEELAEHKLSEGDSQGAIRCLEATLQLEDEETIRERLRELYQKYEPPAFEGGRPSVLPMVGVMLSAAAIGVAAGILDFAGAVGFSMLFDEGTWLSLAILSWTPLIAMAFLGGLFLRQLIVWALVKAKNRQVALGVGLAIVSAFLASYGLPEGRAIGRYITTLLSGVTFDSTKDAILTSGAILTRGGLSVVRDATTIEGLSGGIYTLILFICGAYYFTTSVSIANRTTRWLQRLADIREEAIEQVGRALHPGWIAIASVALGLVLFTSLFPQQEVVSIDAALHHSARGVELMQQGKMDEAIEEFEKALQFMPDVAIVHSDLGWALYYNGEPDKAIVEYQEAIRLDPNLAAAHLGLGWAYYQLGEIEAAGQAFTTAVALAPNDGVAQAGLGTVYLSQDQLQEAESCLTEALRLAPDFFLVHYGLGRLYIQKSDFDKSVPYLQEAIGLNSGYLPAYLDLGMVYMYQAEFEKAVEQFEILIELQPDWGLPHAALASTHYQMDELDLMEQEIQKALALQVGDGYTHHMLGLTYFWLQRFSEAEAQLQEALKLLPDADFVYRDLASVYSAQKKFDLALQMCDKALALHKDYADAYIVRSDIYVEQKDLDRALVELARAQELAPENSNVHSALSFIYFHQGRTADALREAEEAIRLQPYNSAGHTRRAFALHAQGQVDLALAAAQEAVRLSPKHPTPHYILGLCYMDKGENTKAIAEFETFLDLYWDGAYVRDYKAQAEAYLKQSQ